MSDSVGDSAQVLIRRSWPEYQNIAQSQLLLGPQWSLKCLCLRTFPFIGTLILASTFQGISAKSLHDDSHSELISISGTRARQISSLSLTKVGFVVKLPKVLTGQPGRSNTAGKQCFGRQEPNIYLSTSSDSLHWTGSKYQCCNGTLL